MSPRSPQVHMHEDNCNIGNHPHTVPCRHIVRTSQLLLVQPTNPQAPTLKELQQATDLTPYLQPTPAVVGLDNKEQLDALPLSSVVRDAVKDKWEKLDADRWGFPAGQPTVFVNSHILARAWGPVTVVEVGA
jgi:hypothetical protein